MSVFLANSKMFCQIFGQALSRNRTEPILSNVSIIKDENLPFVANNDTCTWGCNNMFQVALITETFDIENVTG